MKEKYEENNFQISKDRTSAVKKMFCRYQKTVLVVLLVSTKVVNY